MKRRASVRTGDCACGIRITTLLLQRRRNYRFQERYPCRLGDTSLNVIYPIDPEDSRAQQCSSSSSSNTSVPRIDDSQDLCYLKAMPLPEVVLRQIFSYLHPTTKVKCSAVCRQWYRLISSRCTWKNAEIRVILSSDDPKYRAAKEFLSKIAKTVHKLCLYSDTELSDSVLNEVLPLKMDKLTVLDVGRLTGFSKNFFRQICKAMPNLEVLNMENAVPVNIECFYELFTDDALPRLKELVLASVQLSDSVMAKLVNWNRALKVLNIDGTFPVHDSWQSEVNVNNAVFAGSLERFYGNGFSRRITVFNDLTKFKNLTLLSLSYCPEAIDHEFLTIKTLHQLEHLHLTGQCSWLRTDSLLQLFTLVGTESQGFPHRLKFLCLSHFYDLNDDVIELITKNCPDLESLNVSRSDSLTNVGMRMIVERLKYLRHLDVSHNRSFDKQVVAQIAVALPHLRFLVAHGCANATVRYYININDIKELAQQRVDIIISVGRSCLLNSALSEDEQRDETIVTGILEQLSEIPGYCCVTDIMKPFL